MSGLVGLDGKRLTPIKPLGFYVVGACQQCGSPFLFHGSGIGRVVNEETQQEEEIVLGQAVYPTCSCKQEDDLQFMVPEEYDPVLERKSIEMIAGRLIGITRAYVKAMIGPDMEPVA